MKLTSRVRVFEWHKRFLREMDNMEDAESAGSSKLAIIDQSIGKVRDVIQGEPILLQLKRFRKTGESDEGSSKSLVPELLPAMAAPNAEAGES
ncbi:hypothetical protein TNCV_3986101 [Trichonephila clavipes]|nr:hypothetical protein TNCV_3986101 [Trichonephila clavipes]